MSDATQIWRGLQFRVALSGSRSVSAGTVAKRRVQFASKSAVAVRLGTECFHAPGDVRDLP
jgi:hypothetical protein